MNNRWTTEQKAQNQIDKQKRKKNEKKYKKTHTKTTNKQIKKKEICTINLTTLYVPTVKLFCTSFPSSTNLWEWSKSVVRLNCWHNDVEIWYYELVSMSTIYIILNCL